MGMIMRRRGLADAAFEGIRGEISSGKLAPGTRIPTLSELEKLFGVSRVTAQRALDRLTRAGFARPDGRHGTFVADKPPHDFRFGLVLTVSGACENWSIFHAALHDAFMARCHTLGGEAVLYAVGSDAEGGAERERLTRDIADGCLAGLLVVGSPRNTLGNLLDEIESKGISLLSIHGRDSSKSPSIVFDWDDFFEKALDVAEAEKIRRIGMVFDSRMGWTPEDARRHIVTAAGYRPIECRSEWLIRADHAALAWIEPPLRLLMRLPEHERPQALIILDDHIVEGVTRIVKKVTAAQAAETPLLIAHANSPRFPTRHVECRWVGFDIVDIIVKAFNLIATMRRGGKIPASTHVAATALEPRQAQLQNKDTRT